jgi:hypothetical protein
VLSILRPRFGATSPPLAASFTLAVVIALAAAASAQTPLKTYVFNLKSDAGYDVLKNGSSLTSARSSASGVLTFLDGSSPGGFYSVEEDSSAGSSAVSITSFQATAAGPGEFAVELAWDVVTDEQIRGYKLYRASPGDRGRGVSVHGQGVLPPSARSFVDREVGPATPYRYTLVVIGENGDEAAWFSRTVTTAAGTLRLEQNVPNPFNPQTTITFELPAAGRVRLDVFDVAGRLVATLHDGNLPPGRHRLDWDGLDGGGRALPTGAYFCRLTAGKKSLSRKMLLLK